MLDLVLKTAPAAAPIDLALAKTHLHIEPADVDQDTALQLAIGTATEHLDGPHGTLSPSRALITQTWTLYLERFPSAHCGQPRRHNFRRDAIHLPLPPLQSVCGVTYTDPDGVEQTLDAARYVGLSGELSALEPARGCAWPAVLCGPRAVAIEFKCGFGDEAAAVPSPIRSAMLLMIGDLFENRELQLIADRAAIVENKTQQRLLTAFRNGRI